MKNFTFIAMTIAACLFMSGCNQINDAVNGSKPANTNSATNNNSTANSNASTNANANTNANSNVTANKNANASTSSVVPSNNATAPKEEVPLTEEAKAFKNNIVGEWIDSAGNKHKFTQDTYEFNIGTGDYQKGSYKIVDENTLELVTQAGEKWSANMWIKGVDILTWRQSGVEYDFRRVK